MPVGSPIFSKDIPYCPVKDLDFSSAKSKIKTDVLSAEQPSKALLIAEVSSKSACHKAPLATVQAPNCRELNEFFTKLSTCGTKPAILSVIAPFADSYIPKCTLPSFP